MDDDRSPGAAVEREVSRFLRRARGQSAYLATQAHPDLDGAGYTVLVTVLELTGAESTPVPTTALPAAIGLHKSTLSRNITLLEELGLIARVADPDDARARLLRLTPAGHAAVRAGRLARRQQLARQMSGWSPGEIEALATLLGRLNDDLP